MAGLPLTIEISHYEPVLGEPVKQTININDNIVAELNSIIEPKSDSIELTTENYDDGGYEWDCAVPIKPDIITNEIQTRRARDLLAVNDVVVSQPSIVETTVKGINGAALNLMHLTFSIFNTIIPSSKN